MKDNPLERFRPYLRVDTIIMIERVREVTGLSIGHILMALLYENWQNVIITDISPLRAAA